MEEARHVFTFTPWSFLTTNEAASVVGDTSRDPWDLPPVLGFILFAAFVMWLYHTFRWRAFGSRAGLTMKSDSRVAKHRGYNPDDVEDILRIACERQVIGLDSQPVAFFYDMDAVKETLLELRAAFASNFEHAIAIKSNPLPPFLRLAAQMGFGLEAASLPEMLLALRAGCAPRRVLFDCPAKSRGDLREALSRSVHINADSLQELARIDVEWRRLAAAGSAPSSRIGIRINPLVGLGTIAALSVSSKRSKFGVPMTAENEERVLEAFRRYRWLVGLHVHVGSQGCSMQQHAAGARCAVALALKIEQEHGRGRIQAIDIGGGLPVNFDSPAVSPTFSQYAAVLRAEVPELFAREDIAVLTEYGRSVSAKAGWAACSVEYTKEVDGGRGVALVQAGADVFLRSCYVSGSFPLRVTAHDRRSGAELRADDKQRPARVYDVAGPLCFAGDVIATDQSFPQLEEGDVVVVHDAGANTLALFSKHCSRRAPPVYGYYRPQERWGGEGEGGLDRRGEAVAVVELKPAETLESCLEFWGR